MLSCDFFGGRIWGWPTTEMHCTDSCKHLCFLLTHIVPPTSSFSNLSTSTIITSCWHQQFSQWPLPLLGFTFDFLHNAMCPPFLLLIPRGGGLWKNVFNVAEGVNGFCGCEFESGCSVLSAHSGNWLSKPKATCRNTQVKVPSSDGQIISFMITSFLKIWSASVEYLLKREKQVNEMLWMYSTYSGLADIPLLVDLGLRF